jgi:Protein of unknown function (DUF2489)
MRPAPPNNGMQSSAVSTPQMALLARGFYIRMKKILIWIENEDKEGVEFPVFEEYFRATTDLPTGQERLHCSREALRRYDERLVSINLKHREEIINACFEIIERYGEGEND